MQFIKSAFLLLASALLLSAASPSFRSSNTTAGAAVATIDLVAPAGLADNDILVAYIYMEDPSVVVTSAPSGWASEVTGTSSSSSVAVYWKRASSESGNYTFAATGAAWMGGYIAAYSGAITSGDPFNATGAVATGTSVSPAATAITTTVDNSMILYFESNAAGNTLSAQPSGFTSRVNATVSALSEKLQPVAGSTGTITGTITSSTWVAVAAALTPAPGITYFGSASTPADNGTGTSAAPATTPPTGTALGDLVFLTGFTRDNAGVSMAITTTGGQTWNSLTAFANTNITGQTFWARFNGTWAANPIITVTGGTSPYSTTMHVFRPTATAYTWAVDVAQATATFTAPGSPFTVSRAGQTTVASSAVAFASWAVPIANTWGSISGSGWAVTGTAQYRNTSGSDQSATHAHFITTSGATSPTVSKNESAGTAGATAVITMKESAPSGAALRDMIGRGVIPVAR